LSTTFYALVTAPCTPDKANTTAIIACDWSAVYKLYAAPSETKETQVDGSFNLALMYSLLISPKVDYGIYPFLGSCYLGFRREV
jgi:hypothetical protein